MRKKRADVLNVTLTTLIITALIVFIPLSSSSTQAFADLDGTTNGSVIGVEQSISLTIQEPVESVWFTTANNINKTITAPYKLNPNYFSEGEFTVKLYANYSNATELSTQFTFIVDANAPVIELLFPSDGGATTTIFSARATDEFTQNITCSLLIDGDDVTSTTIISGSSFNFTYQEEEGFQADWEVSCIDAVGNEDQSETRSATIDLTAPILTAITPSNININTIADFGFEIIESNPIDSCTLYIDNKNIAQNVGVNFTNVNLSAANISDQSEEHEWFVSCYDSAQNYNQTNTLSFYYDITPPTLSNIAIASVGTNTFSVLWSVSESATSTVFYSTNFANFSNSSISFGNSSSTSPAITLSGLESATTYFYLVQSCDQFLLCTNSTLRNITTNTASSGSSNSGGGSGGGGGGSSGSSSSSRKGGGSVKKLESNHTQSITKKPPSTQNKNSSSKQLEVQENKPSKDQDNTPTNSLHEKTSATDSSALALSNEITGAVVGIEGIKANIESIFGSMRNGIWSFVLLLLIFVGLAIMTNYPSFQNPAQKRTRQQQLTQIKLNMINSNLDLRANSLAHTKNKEKKALLGKEKLLRKYEKTHSLTLAELRTVKRVKEERNNEKTRENKNKITNKPPIPSSNSSVSNSSSPLASTTRFTRQEKTMRRPIRNIPREWSKKQRGSEQREKVYDVREIWKREETQKPKVRNQILTKRNTKQDNNPLLKRIAFPDTYPKQKTNKRNSTTKENV